MTIVFRTNSPSEWGTGQGSDLSATQIDHNFWYLYSLILSLQHHQGTGAEIDFFNVVGNQLYVHLTNHAVLGPYTLPVAQWNFRGAWTPTTVYSVMDVVTGPDSGVYLVIFAHTSAGTFSAGANDGLGHDFYAPLLAPPPSLMPAGGTVAQRLAKQSASDYDALWTNDFRNIALYVESQPSSGETVMRYTSTETLTFKAGLSTSKATCDTAATGAVSWTIKKNADVIGTVNWAAAATVATFSFTADVTFVPGDVLTILAPASPDSTQRNIAITLVGLVTGL